jgi:hypothetical protein
MKTVALFTSVSDAHRELAAAGRRRRVRRLRRCASSSGARRWIAHAPGAGAKTARKSPVHANDAQRFAQRPARGR